MNPALAEALELAEKLRDRLEQGDFDGYVSALDAYGSACRIAAESVSDRDRAKLEQLIRVDAETRDLLRQTKDAAGRKLMSLSQGRNVNAAYLAHVSQTRRAPLFEA